jgi:hypothetical protein
MLVRSAEAGLVSCLQVQSAQDAAAAATEALECAEGKESQLLQERSALEKELLASKRREEQLVKKVRQGIARHSTARHAGQSHLVQV